MSISDAQFRAWCAQDNLADRVVLVEFDYREESAGAPVTRTRYYADQPYFDDVAGRAYEDCVNSVPQYSRSLSGERFSQYQSTVGSLEIDNADGEQDDILGLAIDGSAVRFYLGDRAWPLADFRHIFTAMANKASASAFDRVSVQLKDTGVLLNKSIGGDIKIGGTGPNAEQWRSVNFGWVHNVECKVVDSSSLVYAHSDTGVGLYVTVPTWTQPVRDRGVPISYTDNGDGTITLLAAPAGGIATDLLYAPGGSAAFRCVSDAFDHFIGTRCGLTAAGLYYGAGATYAVRPSTGVAAWVTAGGEDYLIGLSMDAKRNAIDLLGELTDSGLCFWAIRRDAKFTFGRLRPNYIAGLGVAAARIIREDDVDKGTFRAEPVTPTYYQLQATMSKNWSLSTDLSTSLTPDARASLTRKGLYAIQPNGTGTDYANAPEQYNLTLVPSPLIETLLSGGFDVLDVPDLQLWMEVRRAVQLPWLLQVSEQVGIDYYDVELGDPVTHEFPRFGWDAGVDMQCIGVDIKLPAKVGLRMLRRHLQGPISRTTTPIPDPPFFLLQLNNDYILQLGGTDRIIVH